LVEERASMKYTGEGGIDPPSIIFKKRLNKSAIKPKNIFTTSWTLHQQNLAKTSMYHPLNFQPECIYERKMAPPTTGTIYLKC
jgi:hypothetical protein